MILKIYYIQFDKKIYVNKLIYNLSKFRKNNGEMMNTKISVMMMV